MPKRPQPLRILLLLSSAVAFAPAACRQAESPSSQDRLVLVMALENVERCDDLARRTGNTWRDLQSSGEAPYDRFPPAVAEALADELSLAALELVVLEELVAGADDVVARELFDAGRSLCRLALEPGDHLGTFDQLQGDIRRALERAREKHRQALRIPAGERAELADRRERLLATARLRHQAAMRERRGEAERLAADELAVRTEEWVRHWRHQEELRRRRAENRRKMLESR